MRCELLGGELLRGELLGGELFWGGGAGGCGAQRFAAIGSKRDEHGVNHQHGVITR